MCGVYVRAFAVWCFECDLLSPIQMTKPQFEAFQRHLFRYRQSNGKPLAWSSQHLHLKEVRQFFAWLTKQNYIPFNPAAELELPKLPRQLPKAILSDDEVDRILQQPDTTTPLGLRYCAGFEVLLFDRHTSRRSCGWPAQRNTSTSTGKCYSSTKAKARRIVTFPIGKRALTWIARYVEHARDQLAIDPKEKAALFLTIDGTPLKTPIRSPSTDVATFGRLQINQELATSSVTRWPR